MEVITKHEWEHIMECIATEKRELLKKFIDDKDTYFDLDMLLQLERKIITIMQEI